MSSSPAQFTQIPNWAIWRQDEICAKAFKLYCLLLSCRNQTSGQCNPSWDHLKWSKAEYYRARHILISEKWCTFEGFQAAFLDEPPARSLENQDSKVSKFKTKSLEKQDSKSRKTRLTSLENQDKSVLIFKTPIKEEQYEGTIRNTTTSTDLYEAFSSEEPETDADRMEAVICRIANQRPMDKAEEKQLIAIRQTLERNKVSLPELTLYAEWREKPSPFAHFVKNFNEWRARGSPKREQPTPAKVPPKRCELCREYKGFVKSGSGLKPCPNCQKGKPQDVSGQTATK